MANMTGLGKCQKKLQTDCGENMNDRATKRSVSASYLYSVETGNKKITGTMLTKSRGICDFSDVDKNGFFIALKKHIPEDMNQ